MFAILVSATFVCGVILQWLFQSVGGGFRSAERKAGDYRAASGRGAATKLPMTGGPALALAALVGGAGAVHFGLADAGWWRVAVPVALFALVGLADDIGKRRGRGLPPAAKTLGCLASAALSAALLTFTSGSVFSPASVARFGVETAFLFCFAVAADFSDGIDGLAAGIGGIAAFSMLIAALVARAAGTVMWGVAFAAVTAFWLFNLPSAWTSRGTAPRRARVYLGDSGALALGGGLAAAALESHLGWAFVAAAAVWALEGFSSLWQAEILTRRVYRPFGRVVRYEGRRAPHTEFPLPLLASPLHHHFELAGWSRLAIVRLFYGTSLVCGVAGAVAAGGGAWLASGYIIAGGVLAALWSFAGIYRTVFLRLDGGGCLEVYGGLPVALAGVPLHRRILVSECAPSLSEESLRWLNRPLRRPDALEIMVRLLASGGCVEEAARRAAAMPAEMRAARLGDLRLEAQEEGARS